MTSVVVVLVGPDPDLEILAPATSDLRCRRAGAGVESDARGAFAVLSACGALDRVVRDGRGEAIRGEDGTVPSSPSSSKKPVSCIKERSAKYCGRVSSERQASKSALEEGGSYLSCLQGYDSGKTNGNGKVGGS